MLLFMLLIPNAYAQGVPESRAGFKGVPPLAQGMFQRHVVAL